MEGFSEEGMFWGGTREELERWKKYKKQKALRFVQEGYSVEWYPNGDCFIGVYTPERAYANQPEIKADVKFFMKPSEFGINKGKISKLSILVIRRDIIAKVQGKPYETVDILFNYDRGADVNKLRNNPQARKLYDIVLQELG